MQQFESPKRKSGCRMPYREPLQPDLRHLLPEFGDGIFDVRFAIGCECEYIAVDHAAGEVLACSNQRMARSILKQLSAPLPVYHGPPISLRIVATHIEPKRINHGYSSYSNGSGSIT